MSVLVGLVLIREESRIIKAPGFNCFSNFSIEGWFRQITTSASLTTGDPIGSSEKTTEQLAVPPRISGPYDGNQDTSLPS